jgi:hypothetical protein
MKQMAGSGAASVRMGRGIPRASRLAIVVGAVATLAAVVVGAGASVAAIPAASADLQDFSFASMDVDYTLTRAEDGVGELRVVETFVAVFPETDQNRGMQRLLPNSYGGAPLEPRLVSVTDADGDPRPVETEDGDDALIVTSRGADYVHGEQTYVFTYTMRNVTRSYADTDADEFYWDVNGLDWAQPFGRITARLHIDAELGAALTGETACYVGAEGSTASCPISSGGEDGAGASGASGGDVTVVAEASAVPAYQTLTMAVGFARDTFVSFDPSYLASPWGWLQGLFGLGLVGSFVAAGVVRRRRLADAPGRPTIIAEYDPPRTVDALEGAILLSLPAKAIPAEVLEQAVVGSIRIVEGTRRLFGGVRLEAHLVDGSRADGDGRLLLNGLFGAGAQPGAVFEFGRQDTRFSSAARSILSAAEKELVRRGLRRPVGFGPRALPMAIALVATIGVFGFGVAALNASVTPWVPLGLMVASIIGLFIVGGLVARKPLTTLGAATRDHLVGLKVFIEWAEADRIRMLQSPAGAERTPIDASDPRQMLRLYETLLPWAVVFGQEKEWAEHLTVLYSAVGTPGWYIGTAGFNAAAFSSGIGSLSASASSASSTGGSSGGGSAGGGGGGGGGGGV